MKRLLWMVFLVGYLVIWLAAAGRADAQVRGGSLSGVVRDADGRPVAHAQVVVLPLGRGTLTDLSGRFELRHLPPGDHRVQVSLIGYGPVTEAVRIGEAGARLELVVERTPLSLPGVQVTATPAGRDPAAVTQATTQLTGRALERELGATLAQTLRAQPGLAVRSMGPAATAPVVRGLTGDRVLVLQDGQRTADLAGSADDHGVTIDPLAAQRVEVVRGPATLLYGNNALGGVVNVISGDVPGAVPLGPEWAVAGQAESAYAGVSASVRGQVPLGERWVVGVRGGARQTGDMRIPHDPTLGDRLENTELRNRHGSLGLGYVGGQVQGGGAVRGYDFTYGLPVPPGSDPVTLRGGRLEGVGHAEWALPSRLFPSLRLDGTWQHYLHDEVDTPTGSVLQTFELGTRTANLLLRQGGIGRLAEGAWGVSTLLKEYAATGPAALTPPADSRALGVFGFQEIALGGEGGEAGPALQLGGRFDQYLIESHTVPKFGRGVERDFRALSGSVGVRVPLGAGSTLGLSWARSFRAPTVEELFSGAPHAGTGSVEFGNPELEAERGRSLEAVLRVQRARWNGQVAAYRNAIDNYVHLVAQGDTLLDGARLPVFRYGQTGAVLQGVEGSLEWAARSDLALGLMGDVLHARQRDGTPLSFMPPPRIGASVRWEPGPWSLGVDGHHEFEQDRVGAADELPTEAHTVLRATAGVRVTRRGVIHSVSLRAENLTNELHREATSRIKDFAPGPGRNLALLYRVYF